MGKRNSKCPMELHDFYCIKCGNKGISLMRKQGYQRKTFHRKKLYCPYCKLEINHIECKTQDDIYNFKEDFENGVYVDEVEESLAHVRDTSIGQKHVG